MISTWIPSQSKTEEGKPRRVGVEIELAGLQAEQIADCVTSSFGGETIMQTPTEFKVQATSLGDFTVELDATAVKKLTEKYADNETEGNSLTNFALDVVTRAAEQFVPWEVVTPPVPVTELVNLNQLIERLRDAGALGTRHALHYAFGVHLNPELPALAADTILSYLRAFLCLYDWIVSKEKLDTTRRLTPYIKHFKKDYIALAVNPKYCPTLDHLIDDYLACNPTRNRSLDLLPLFAHLDKDRVRSQLKDERIKARPTLHYRLPNCDIDNPDWSLGNTWALWLAVEKLASQPQQLESMCRAYQQELSRLTHPFDDRWVEYVSKHIEPVEPLG